MIGERETGGVVARDAPDFGGEEVGGVGEVVDEEAVEGGDLVCGWGGESAQGGLEGRCGGEGGAGAGEGLVEITGEEEGSRRVQGFGEVLQEAEVILPGFTVAAAGGDMGVRPGDADTNDADGAERGGGEAGDEAARGQTGVAEGVDFAPGVAAPEEDFAAAGLEGVAIIGFGGDGVAAGGEEGGDGLGQADQVRFQGGEDFPDGGAFVRPGQGPFRVPDDDSEGHGLILRWRERIRCLGRISRREFGRRHRRTRRRGR